MEKQKIQVKGIAIKSGVSRNNILYTGEELKLFAPTLQGRPILKDHISHTDNAIGLVTSAKYDDTDESIFYNGWVKEDGTGVIEKIDDGRIKEVSIGALVKTLVKEKEDSEQFIAKGITAMELSTTPTPGICGTSISQTLKQIEQLNVNEKAKNMLKVTPILEDINSFTPIIKNNVQELQKEKVVQDNIEIQNTEEKMDEKIAEAISSKEKEIEQLKEDLAKKELREKELTAEKLKEQLKLKEQSELEKENEELKKEIASLKKKIEDMMSKPKENLTKGKVVEEKEEKIDSMFENYVLGRDDLCRGNVIYRESYNDKKYKNLNPDKSFYQGVGG